MVKFGLTALACLAAAGATPASLDSVPRALVRGGQEAAKADLTLALSTDKTDYVIGDEIQAEVTLASASDKALDVAELTFDERSLSFDISYDPGAGKTKQFLFSIVRPDPHLVDRLPPARVTLAPKKSMAGLFRIPTLKPGSVTVTAVYKDGGKETKSGPAKVKVAAQAGDAAKLAAILDTSMGTFQIDLMPEEAPNNVCNFVTLARRGFYNNMIFHRVVKNSWIQTGCPYDNGYGGPGYALKSEADGQAAAHDVGTVAMSGNMKNGYTGSQFFIDLARIPSFDKKFTVIGKVAAEAGHEVLKKIGGVEVERNTDKPSKEDVRLKDVKIVVVK